MKPETILHIAALAASFGTGVIVALAWLRILTREDER